MSDPSAGGGGNGGAGRRRRRRRGRRKGNGAQKDVPVNGTRTEGRDDRVRDDEAHVGNDRRGKAAGRAVTAGGERPAGQGARKRRRRRRSSESRMQGGRAPETTATPEATRPSPGSVPVPPQASTGAPPHTPPHTPPHASAEARSDTSALPPHRSARPAVAPSTRTREPLSADAQAARRARAERETSAGGIVYRVHDGEALFLLIRDSYRNWGFPKGHLEAGEQPQDAALREVQEETGLPELELAGAIETIDWFFRFRGKLVHKVCHFYLMRTDHARTVPQREEGITACRWAPYDEATRLISYANARAVLSRAHAMLHAPGADGAAD